MTFVGPNGSRVPPARLNGVGRGTAERAKQQVSGDGTPEPERITGREGKSYPATKPSPPPPPDEVADRVGIPRISDPGLREGEPAPVPRDPAQAVIGRIVNLYRGLGWANRSKVRDLLDQIDMRQEGER